MIPILYTYRRCPYPMRARMALLQAGMFCVVMGLQIDPALRIGAKERVQAQGRVQGDAAQAFKRLAYKKA
jgi:hypothetical protein